MNELNNQEINDASFSSLPFEDPSNNIIILDDRIKDIPPLTKSNEPIITDNNIVILDDKIKDIPAKNSKVSFKKASIIFPIISFAFVSILFMYIFINNSKANTSNLIRIEENKKVGYIDDKGTIVVKAKYSYGTEYHKGLAIVKNDNNLYGILDGKGALHSPFGVYYSISLFDDYYIASKITNSGLKYAVLDNKLSEITRFEYDEISYNNKLFLFKKDETMGILNTDGKEIYTFKVDEVDDKKIDVEVSEVTSETNKENRYAKVKVNKSSTIVNVYSGKELYGYTLNDINVLNNNVFYIKADKEEDNSTYFIIKDDDIKYKTDKYKRVRVDDVNSNIAICVKDDMNIDYINIEDKTVINTSENNEYTYGSGLLLEKTHSFDTNEDKYNIYTYNDLKGSFSEYIPVTKEFKNEKLAVEISDKKYNYINSTGNLINDQLYDYIEDFNEYGYAIVAKDNNYGIIDKDGREIVPLKYNKVEFIDKDLFKNIQENLKQELFVIKNEKDEIGLINNKNQVIIEPKYKSIEYITHDYPFILVIKDDKKVLLNLSTKEELPIEVKSNDIKIAQNYLFIYNSYYNYSGDLLYSIK
ncbi:MAG: WG repeat-containing protein [Bacilli bacterium]|nr:WG repeat-containing protein [Bacilli bacterium]